MEKIIGNFLTQANKDFPLDCETLEAIQNNIAIAEMIGSAMGDKIILSGCESSVDGTTRNPGYVFLKTSDFPGGEVLRFEGGATGAGMYLKKEEVCITANGVDYPKAYTRRYLASGVGEENFRWNDFKLVRTPEEFEALIEDLSAKILDLGSKITPKPLGIVEMWAGVRVPEGYSLCDGREMSIAEYPELYAALGKTFNTAVSASGSCYSTQNGFFRLPDLRGRFVVGYHDSDADYQTYGNGGGEKKHALTVNEIPSHKHWFRDYYYPFGHQGYVYDTIYHNGGLGSGKTSNSNNNILYYRHETESTGGASTHENRPPYYVLAYIMKVR